MAKWLVFNLVAIVLAIGGVILAFNKIDGWGWFIFCALVALVYPSSEEDGA